ncbi:MAG: oligosaccharide flippase family protein [Cyanobacteria bacterium]|nr:oligosaccharide flippase family protein [Cyanobacteria bacterium CG_2015-16_32_12]NCO78582.1 oligosaccharide flippase family protein [Cyanobacteria bacterium CG_2015-22_32_23]NCQ02974.1 oligosaccharide flippase family protein [Cyanobacteria bacterium CG_2015-09_32_10]NCQ40821.1 oligosaccharide flippase family protein [Cyanobacteria bacterium CG_2015-04_32_10]NCS83665.1 oligosaccharide flippase family protein [Cyanobacteria bacterium CG_2015-02_32_10]
MSFTQKIAFGVGISWLSRIISIVVNLFFIPIMFRYLGKEELGLWFLMSNSQALLGLLGMGIAPVITKRIALAKGKSGATAEVELNNESKQEIGDLVTTGNILLRGVAFFIFFIAAIGGYFLINQFELTTVSPQTILWSWIIICLGYAVGVWVEYLNCLLTGMGYVGFNQLILAILSVGTTLISIVVVINGGGLFHLAVILVFTNLAQRFLLLALIRKYKPKLLDLNGKWNINIIKSLIQPAFDFWFKGIGTFLILRSDQYFIGTLIGVSAIAPYQATYQLVSNLRVLAVSLALSSIPFIGQLWQNGNLPLVHKIVKKVCFSGLLLLSIGNSFLLVSGKDFLQLWIGKDAFVGYPILIIFCVMLFFETQNACLINCARATGIEQYAIPSIIAGILNIILTMILIKPFGLLGVSLATLISLMLTENWYCLYQPLSRLKLKWVDYFREVILIVFIVFLLNYSLNLAVKFSLIPLNNQYLSVFSTMLTSLLVFLWFLWHNLLDDNLKVKIISKTKQNFLHRK